MNGNEREEAAKMEERREAVVYMWGYLPGASPEKAPILSPVLVQRPDSSSGGDLWKDVCGGGCGFALGISASGNLITWASTEDENQCLLTGKHGETPEAFVLPTEAAVVKAATGWAHCVSVTETGEVYTWGWKECIPTGKIFLDLASGGTSLGTGGIVKECLLADEQATTKSQELRLIGGEESQPDNKSVGDEVVVKRRRVTSAKQEPDSSTPGDDYFIISPSLVTMDPGVRITTVAAGGRHTLALSDMGQVWGWGYGGEGQLGLGSRVKTVSSPHVIPCVDSPPSAQDGQGSRTASQVAEDNVKGIACGGRHSAVITDSGALLTFGWGLYGQCGQGNTNDLLRPTSVSSLSGTKVERIAAGLWHTVCITVEGRVYTFGGNQFGQLGTGVDQAESLPRLLDTPNLEGKHAKIVSCGARHSAILTDDGELFSWGWNKYGQLGLGDSIDRDIPSRVSLETCLPKNVACGWWHTLLLADMIPK